MDLLVATNSVPFADADFTPPAGTAQWATSGNPGATPPVPPTQFPAYHYNHLVQEIINVILGGGETPSSATLNQLLTAIEAIIGKQSPSSLTANGWKKYPDPNSPTGYTIRQWGQISNSTPFENATVTLPIAFPNVFFDVQSTIGSNVGDSGSPTAWCGTQPLSLSQFQASAGTANGTGTCIIWWVAEGY